jgi:hypothetical protein
MDGTAGPIRELETIIAFNSNGVVRLTTMAD